MRYLRWIRWTVAALVLVEVAALGHTAAGVPSARAQVAAAVGFDPASGGASDVRLVSFSGFGSGETLDFTFTDPNGNAAQVGNGDTWYAVTQDDGTGTFEFTPGDWLSPLTDGTWTVTITGETSGMQTTATFTIDD
jgi:hypothetical protein